MKVVQSAVLFAVTMLAFSAVPAQADDKIIPVRVVVITWTYPGFVER
jgi:hypothetical protein